MKQVTRKRLMTALALMAAGAGGFMLWTPWQPQSRPPDVADALVVLGGTSSDRSTLAAKLYRENHAKRIIVTGDRSELMLALIESGIPEAALVHEPSATNTVENALLVQPLLDKLGARRVILVTSWYHAGRALRIFRRLMPDREFSTAYIPENESADPNGKSMLRREKFAILYPTLIRGVPCLW